MHQRDILCEKAVKRFPDGYNCAQSVLLTMFEFWDSENELVPKIATAFGGGIGRCGSVCGALTGGVMALGIKYGTNESSVEKRLEAYAKARKLYKEFERLHGSVLCRELIGYNLSNPSELDEAHKANVFEEKCAKFVENIIKLVLELTEQ